MKNFAWEAPGFFTPTLVFGDVDEDQFAELMADFVWEHRHELSRLLNERP